MTPIRRASPWPSGSSSHRASCRAFLLTLLLTLLLAPIHAPRAWADPPDARTAAADAAGRAHFQRGQRLSAAGDYAAAYREFAAGYAVTKRPLFLFNMAEAARASGDVARARESYLEFLRVDPTSALSATARARLDDLDRAAGASPPDRAAPPPPAVTTVPPEPAREPLPLLPPSATRAQPPGMTSGDPAPAAPLATSRAEDTPVWKKWPFWAVVGGVIAGGVVAVYAVRRDAGPCGAGCTEINFR